ncbi:hypothetical protein [Parasitella parasitica]|uniref:Uncharacterized protein n=1 Tax=Parasitella parasitica TaxID=35722 RepID=A0A0B7NM58_9FUNG|nr:hypothetical protein [Parasitella parasitica]
MNEKACSEEIGDSEEDIDEDEDEEGSLPEAEFGSTFDSIEMMDGAGNRDCLEEANDAATAAVASVSLPSLTAHRLVSPSMPQPRGTKNSSQLNRFNDTFERFAESLLYNRAASSASPSWPSCSSSCFSCAFSSVSSSSSRLDRLERMLKTLVSQVGNY